VRRYRFSPADPKARAAMSSDPRTLAQAIHSATRLGRYLPTTARIKPPAKGKKSKRNRGVFTQEPQTAMTNVKLQSSNEFQSPNVQFLRFLHSDLI
jgi:hypothetical protein